MNNNKVFVAATTLKLISILGLLMMPFQIGVLVANLGMTQSQAGFVATLETSGLAVGVAVVAFRLIPMSTRCSASFGVALVVIGNLISSGLSEPLMLMIARAITGLGYGLANATASRLIASCFSTPETAAGKMYAVTYVVATLMYYLFPPLITEGGSSLFFGGLTLLVVVVLPALFWLPKQSPEADAQSKIASHGALFLRKPVLSFFSIEILLMIGLGAVWSFGERFAVNIDLSPERIGLYYALSSGSQFLGACLAAYLGLRFGRSKPLVLSLIPWAVLSVLMATAWNETVYAVGILGYQFMLAFYLPYLLGLGAAMDKGGNVAAAVIGVQIFSFGAGSFAGGLVADHYSLPAIGWLALLSCLIAMVCMPRVASPLDKDSDGEAVEAKTA